MSTESFSHHMKKGGWPLAPNSGGQERRPPRSLDHLSACADTERPEKRLDLPSAQADDRTSTDLEFIPGTYARGLVLYRKLCSTSAGSLTAGDRRYGKAGLLYTDFWAACAEAPPKEQHRATGKGEGQTCHVERFNSRHPGPRPSKRQPHRTALAAVRGDLLGRPGCCN